LLSKSQHSGVARKQKARTWRAFPLDCDASLAMTVLMADGERFELSVAQPTFSLFTIVWLERASLWLYS